MSVYQNFLTINTVDVNGTQAKTKVPIAASILDPTSSGPQAIKTAIANASNDGVYGTELSTDAAVTTYTPTTSQTQTVQDRLMMSFNSEGGGKENYQIPAPIGGIYLTGSGGAPLPNVNPAQTQVAAYITAMTDYATDETGALLETLKNGKLLGKKLAKSNE
jgi:hypothetical protein